MLRHPDGERSFDALRELLPAGASPGGVFMLRFEHGRGETERLASENKLMLLEPLRREEE